LKSSWFTIFTVFLYLFVILYTYAIVGILAFNDEVQISIYTNGTQIAPCTSVICQEYFQNIYKAIFTMFQVMSGDGWFSGVAREGESKLPYFSFIFFSSFYIFTTMILLNLLTGIILGFHFHFNFKDAIQGGVDDFEEIRKLKEKIKNQDKGIKQDEEEFEVKSDEDQIREKIEKIKLLLGNLETNLLVKENEIEEQPKVDSVEISEDKEMTEVDVKI
jgi:hypothetical protein